MLKPVFITKENNDRTADLIINGSLIAVNCDHLQINNLELMYIENYINYKMDQLFAEVRQAFKNDYCFIPKCNNNGKIEYRFEVWQAGKPTYKPFGDMWLKRSVMYRALKKLVSRSASNE